MAWCSWSYQRTAKPNSLGAVAASPSSRYLTSHSHSHSHLFLSSFSICSSSSLSLSLHCDETLIRRRLSRRPPHFLIVSSSNKAEPRKVMISGAPASGKGTQCRLTNKKYGLVHIAAGDLLRDKISSGSKNGRRANEYMEKGQLVPNEIVVTMVKDRLLQSDCQENGWLLDGYPRSLSQAMLLKNLDFSQTYLSF